MSLTEMKALFIVGVFLLAANTPTFAADTITGKVTNGTTGRPAAGAEVILLKLSEGMQEEARTKSDAQGRFELPLKAADVPHLVRVFHQKVNYHRPAPPGTTSVEVQVFDSAPKVDGISAAVDLMRVQAQGDSLQVTEMVAVKNESKPPRTLMGERTLDIYLPEGAQIETSLAAGPGGMPVNSAPVPVEKGHYGFIFPLRPGETRFQVSYRLPYSGEAEFKPRLAYRVEDFAVMLPKSMEFAASTPGTFNLADDQGGVVVQMVKNVGPGAGPSFRIKGTGTLPDDAQSETAGAAGTDNRPGGGIGRPSELPDPLHAYRWYILSGLAGLLVVGAVWFVKRQPQAASLPANGFGSVKPQAATAPGRTMLLDALKEELFQLETERLQQKISQEEYEKTKAALDHTLQRALSRKSGT
ncbi:MAG: carboxypeptidase-like regulatory domain-containing protein [Acidobacteriales bacterium]|nr:carboxypeptidase-like regulatory domain-containing protein [Terriglobales bacterium]